MAGKINEYRALDEIRAMHVPSKRDLKLAEHISMLLRRDASGVLLNEPVTHTRGLETRGLIVVGPARCGKTELIESVLCEGDPFSQFWTENPNGFIKVTTPNPATFKSVGLQILSELGYSEVSPTKQAWEIWETVRHRIALLGVRMLWLDEAHDVMKTKADKNNVLRTLKTLMQGKNAIIIILSGTQMLSEMVMSDAQISGRFHKYHFPNLSYASDRKGLSRLIDRYGELLGRSIVYDDELIQRLMHAANYRLGFSIELVVEAIGFAINRHKGDITIDDFAGSYALQTGCDLADNVFLSINWPKIDCDPEPKTEIVKPRSPRKK